MDTPQYKCTQCGKQINTMGEYVELPHGGKIWVRLHPECRDKYLGTD